LVAAVVIFFARTTPKGEQPGKSRDVALATSIEKPVALRAAK
jgi:hypothetical protein